MSTADSIIDVIWDSPLGDHIVFDANPEGIDITLNDDIKFGSSDDFSISFDGCEIMTLGTSAPLPLQEVPIHQTVNSIARERISEAIQAVRNAY